MFYAFIWLKHRISEEGGGGGGGVVHKATVRINKYGLYAFK